MYYIILKIGAPLFQMSVYVACCKVLQTLCFSVAMAKDAVEPLPHCALC